MPFKIMIEIGDNEAKLDDVQRISHYMGDALKKMGFTFSLDCYRENIEALTGPGKHNKASL